MRGRIRFSNLGLPKRTVPGSASKNIGGNIARGVLQQLRLLARADTNEMNPEHSSLCKHLPRNGHWTEIGQLPVAIWLTDFTNFEVTSHNKYVENVWSRSLLTLCRCCNGKDN